MSNTQTQNNASPATTGHLNIELMIEVKTKAGDVLLRAYVPTGVDFDGSRQLLEGLQVRTILSA